jgi:hypothetical protein
MENIVEHAMIPNRHSTIAHAAYLDLLQSLRDEAVAAIRGTPTRVMRGTRSYWYDSYRVGSEVRRTYIGDDTPELAARLKIHADLKGAAEERKRHRARLTRILRAEGFVGVDAGTGSMLSALATAGVFRLGGTVVGTVAFKLYEGELGLRYGFDDLAQTNDIDIASFERLSLALGDAVSEPLTNVLGDFRFEPAPSLEPNKTWRWRQTRNDLLVEFLTASFDETENLKPLPTLGVHAQSLHFLNYVLAEPIQAAIPYRNGVLVQIPRPERFAIHKLIVADRRREGPNSLKAEKDRRQARFLIGALIIDRPDDLREAVQDAQARGPQWRKRLEATLARMPDIRACFDALGVNGR